MALNHNSSLAPLASPLSALMEDRRMNTKLLAPFLLPLAAACSSGPIAKAALDDEVRRLCAIDGGIKVYETVKLPAENFNQQGNVLIPDKANAKPNDDYYYEWNVNYLLRGNPELWRSEHQIVRAHDGKIIGKSVRYSRRGGDASGPWHESSFSCPEIGSQSSLEKSIFGIGGNK